jgi:arylsulfatase A-like enzyme
LIIKDLNKKEGQVCAAPVQLLDIYPTLVEMCHLKTFPALEGHSLTNLIKNPTQKWAYPALSFYGVGNIAVRDERFRLIKYEDGSTELYDLEKDPNEWYNLANNRKFENILQRLSNHIPLNWAPSSKYSTYNINEYFINKVKSD